MSYVPPERIMTTANNTEMMSNLMTELKLNKATLFPDDVFRLIKSFTKPNVWCCDRCDEEFDMKKQQPEYVNGLDLSVKPLDDYVPVCQECLSSEKCSMCWELAYSWMECFDCDQTYCENCFNEMNECPNCYESDEEEDDE